MSTSSSSSSNLAPEKWVKKIKKMLQDGEVVADTPVCIHKVPQRLRFIKPEAYTPLYIGLGPYHHWCEDLYVMEPCKLIASKNSLKDCHNIDDEQATQRLTSLANSLKKEHINQVYASYDRHLGVDTKTLAWMMVIDGIFLLQFFQGYINPNKSCLSSKERTAFLVDQNKSFYHSILQDIMKLENQIPIFVLDHVLPPCEISKEQNILHNMLCETCKKLSPFKVNLENLRREDITITKYAHLLELLYYLIAPYQPNNSSSQEYRDDDDDKGEPLLENNTTPQERLTRNCCSNITIHPPNYEMAVLGTALNQLGCLHQFVTHSRPLRVIGKLIRRVTALFPSITNLCQENLTTDPESGGSSSSSEGNDKEAPKVDEIEIPTVSQLLRVGIEFCRIHQDDPLRCIGFNKKTRKFHLPKITIDANTEVIIRNLVAYEAVGISSPSILARYTELMNGIIDTAEDVRLLRERGIIVSYLKSDDAVAQLWNGMSRSIRLSRIDSMDKAIRDVNEYFNNKTRVKCIRFTKDCMFCCWKISMLLLTLMVVVLMAIQSFCEVYKCPRALGPATQPGSHMS